MKKIILMFFFVMSNIMLMSQVGISDNNDNTEPHQNSILHVKSTNGNLPKGVILPKVKNETKMPYYDASQPDNYTDDADLEGATIYSSDDGTFFMYDGTKWTPTDTTVSANLEIEGGISRFVGKHNDDKVSIACVLGICGNGDKVNFRGDDGYIINELEIQPTSSNQNEFKITKAGTYAITGILTGFNLNLGGNLLGSAILEVKRKGTTAWREVTRSGYTTTQALGIGGSEKVGAAVRAVMFLEEDDHVRIWFGKTGTGVLGSGCDATNDHNSRRYNTLVFEKYRD